MLLTSMEILPLDGTSASTTHAVSPTQGGDQASQIVPEACLVLSLHTPQRGARGRGRVYIGPICEGIMANGLVDGTVESDTVTAWGAFQTSVNGAGVTWVVASYRHADQHPIIGLRADAVCGVQRRRLNQLR
jgi:hypothetical protein